jgi:outer membrane lipoprotein-sorting protein
VTTQGWRRNRAVRWLVPAGVVAVLAVGATVTAGSAGAASPDLPERTAAQLLAAVAQAEPAAFSGTATETADLGLPALPGTSSTSLQWQSLVSGSHTAKVWVASPTQVRLALVGDLAESDVVRNGSDLWVWQSSANTVDHVTLPAHSEKPATAPSTMPSITPDTVAAKVLAAVDPTTKVTVDRTAYVAGRPVYELVLEPKQTGSLVASVRVAIDSETSMPLGVWVYAVGQASPAFESAFTSITFATPDPSVFAFSPPAGATVTQHALPTERSGAFAPSGNGMLNPPISAARPSELPRVIGHGWTAVVAASGLPSLAGGIPQGSGGSGGSSAAAMDLLLKAATPVSGSYGSGHLIETSLLTVLLLDDGRVFAGAVTPTVLEQAASSAR